MFNTVLNFMKYMKWVGLLAAVALPLQILNAQTPESEAAVPVPDEQQRSAPVPTDLSPTVREVLRLTESGVGDQVVLAYIQNAQAPFNLSADHILYLRDLGLTPEVTTAMLNHDKGLPVQMSATTPQPQPEPVPQAPPPPSEPVTAPLTPTYVSNPPVEVNYFYNDLSPYGEWVSLDGFGWCWQPRAVVVNRGWRPYCDGGHWIYTDAGWYWQSDYSWGWAPFHYGRWHMHERCGWVWIPDTTWAPAWVIWRSSGDACGWAPVPPHATFDVRFGWRFNGINVGMNFDFGLHERDFFFIGLHDFHHRDLGHYRLPPTQVTRIYNRTTVINNYTVQNNVIVNRGLPVERVSAATHTEFRKVTVREGSPASGGRVVTRSTDRDVVYRPTLRAPARVEHVTAQRVDAGHPVVQHTEVARMERSSSVNRIPQANNRGTFRTPERSGGAPVRNQERATVPQSRVPERSTVERNQPVPQQRVPERSIERSQPQPNRVPDRSANDRRSTVQSAPLAPSANRSVETTRNAPAEVPRTAPLRPDSNWRTAPSRDQGQTRSTYAYPETRSSGSQGYTPKSGQQAAENPRYERPSRSERPAPVDRSDRGNRSDRSDRSDGSDSRGRKN
jgi:hypothetical protein